MPKRETQQCVACPAFFPLDPRRVFCDKCDRALRFATGASDDDEITLTPINRKPNADK